MKKAAIIAALALSAAALATPANAVSFQYPVVTGDVLMLGATVRETLTTVDNNDSTFRIDNGLQWHNWNGGDDGSMGFADVSATLNLGSCDTNLSNADVMCWHNYNAEGEIAVTQGYRWDQQTSVDDGSGFYRVMFTSDDPGYYPSGAQYNVDSADLDGWTACWADDWGTEWGETDVTYTDLFAACDGDYLMMATVENVTEGTAPVADDNLAETGVEVAPILGFGAIAVIAGAFAVRRRRA